MRYTADDCRALGIDLAHMTITLDGAPVDRVVAFDVPAGKVWRYQQNDRGAPVHDGTAFLEYVTEGAVRIFLRHTKAGAWPHAVPEPGGLPLATVH